jgi:hypothetical protein
MLTPGEFVINKKASKSIGYGNLNKMNKQGVVGFAAGGTVTSGRHNYGVPSAKSSDGGGAGFGTALFGMTAAIGIAQQAIEKMGDKSEEASREMAAGTIAAERSAKTLTSLALIYIVLRGQ